MTPEQFYSLDEMEQAEIVWEGKHIADREDNEHGILLYQYNDLNIEVYYHKEYNPIRKFNAFSRVELLDIYTYRIKN